MTCTPPSTHIQEHTETEQQITLTNELFVCVCLCLCVYVHRCVTAMGTATVIVAGHHPSVISQDLAAVWTVDLSSMTVSLPHTHLLCQQNLFYFLTFLAKKLILNPFWYMCTHTNWKSNGMTSMYRYVNKSVTSWAMKNIASKCHQKQDMTHIRETSVYVSTLSVCMCVCVCVCVYVSPQARWGSWQGCCLPSWWSCLQCCCSSIATKSRLHITISGFPRERRTRTTSTVSCLSVCLSIFLPVCLLKQTYTPTLLSKKLHIQDTGQLCIIEG